MSRKFSLGGGHDVTVYDDALWDAMQSAVAYCYTVFPQANVAYRTLRVQHDEARALVRKYDAETGSIHADMLELGRILGVPYDGLSSPAGYLHGDLIPAMTALLKELGRVRQDLAAERFNRREWQDRARDMERERDAALDPGKAASEPLPEMGQPEFGSKAKSRWARYHGNRKAKW